MQKIFVLCCILSNTYVISAFENFLRSPLVINSDKFFKKPSTLPVAPYRKQKIDSYSFRLTGLHMKTVSIEKNL